jgi:hypothetical protein
MALPLAPILNPGEPPTSYLSRLAAANGVSAREFCRDWGIAFQDLVEGKAGAIAELAKLGGVPAEDLMRFAFIRGEGFNFTHRGQNLVRASLRCRAVHICPTCLLQDIQQAPKLKPGIAVYNRADWSIDAITTCLIHKTGLVEIADGRVWETRHDFVVLVEPHLSRLGLLAKHAKPQLPSCLERYVVSRLDGAQHDGGFLGGLDLHVVIKTCEAIGAVAEFGRRVDLKTLTVGDRRRAGERGFGVVAGGSAGIWKFLGSLQASFAGERGGRGVGFGPAVAFGSLYRFLKSGHVNRFYPKDQAFAAVRTVVADFIKQHYPLGPGDLVFGEPVTERILHSVQTLSVETGLNPVRLRKLVFASGLVSVEQMAFSNHNIIFSAAAGLSAVDKAKDAMTLPAVARYLGASLPDARTLYLQQFIRPFTPAGALHLKPRFAASDLDEFLLKLTDGAGRVKQRKSGQCSIVAAARRAHCAKPIILRMILEKRLAWVGRWDGVSGYASVLVNLDEIRSKVRGADHGGLGARETALALKTSDWVAAALIAEGHLKKVTLTRPVSRYKREVVMPEEIERFRKAYVSAWELQADLKKRVSDVKRDLAARGVKPAFDPHKVHAVFYRREDL